LCWEIEPAEQQAASDREPRSANQNIRKILGDGTAEPAKFLNEIVTKLVMIL
jgi:hypothetical protein